MPIEWDVPPEYAARNTASIRAAFMASLNEPGKVRVNSRRTATAPSQAAPESSKRLTRRPISRVPAWSPETRQCLSPTTGSTSGSATQSPQETRRFRRADHRHWRKPTSMCICAIWAGGLRPATATGPQAEQAIYIRQSEPRHSPFTCCGRAREDFINTTYRSMGRGAGCAPLSDADGWADCDGSQDSDRRESPWSQRRLRCRRRRLLSCPITSFSMHRRVLAHPRGHAARRRRAGPNIFIRESFMDELAPRRRQGPVSLSPRADLAHQPFPTRPT